MWEKFLNRVRANPARFRALVLAILVLAAGFLPGLPVDAIDAAVAAFLVFAVGEGSDRAAKTVRKRRKAPMTPE